MAEGPASADGSMSLSSTYDIITVKEGSKVPRRGSIAKRDVLPDPLYNSKLVTRLINNVMYDGKRGVAQKIVYGAFDIIREVNHPLVKVVFDIYHQQIMEGNIIPNITSNLDCIAHLHCAGHPGRNELQYGENDYSVIFRAVDKALYTGCCGLEYSPKLEPTESLKEFKRLYM